MTDITFTYTPDVGYQPDIVPAVNRVKFGGGYVQTSARGINLDGATLRMSFTNRTKTEVDGIVWALKQSLGGRIIYTLPGETTARLWDVQRWTPPTCGEGGQVWSMEVELAETFEDGHANWNPLHMDFDSIDGWEWLNKGNSTAAVVNGELVLTVPFLAPAKTRRGLVHAIPKQGSWAITSEMNNNSWGTPTHYSISAIGVRNSRTGNLFGIGGTDSAQYTGQLTPGVIRPVAERVLDSITGTSYAIRIEIDAQAGTIKLTRSQQNGSYSFTKTFQDLGGRPDQVCVVNTTPDAPASPSYTGNNIVRVPYIYVDPL